MKGKLTLVFILVLVIFSFSITNSSSITTIDNYAYVVAIGFDLGDNDKLKLTFQIANQAQTGSGDSSSSESISPTITNTVQCNTIDSGINLINSYLSKKISLAHCKIIVFSEELAALGISEYICTLSNNIEMRPTCNVLISECEAKYFLENATPVLDEISSRYYDAEILAEKNTGFTSAVTLSEFFNSYYDTFQECSAILGSISNVTPNKMLKTDDSEYTSKDIPIDSQKNIENLGMAVFKGDKYVGKLNGIESLCYLIVTNKFKNATISIPSPFEETKYISLFLYKANSNNNVQFINNSPFISCNVQIKCRVKSASSNIDYTNKDTVQKIEEYANSYFSSQILDYLYKTSNVYKSDVSGFGQYAVKNFDTLENWNKYNWLNNFQNSIFKVKVSTNLKSSYLILGNSK